MERMCAPRDTGTSIPLQFLPVCRPICRQRLNLTIPHSIALTASVLGFPRGHPHRRNTVGKLRGWGSPHAICSGRGKAVNADPAGPLQTEPQLTCSVSAAGPAAGAGTGQRAAGSGHSPAPASSSASSALCRWRRHDRLGLPACLHLTLEVK